MYPGFPFNSVYCSDVDLTFQGSDWPGLSVSNPFSFAEATVVVVVDGVSSLGLKEGHHYPLITDEDESVIWQSLHDRVLIRYPGQNATLLRMDPAEEVGVFNVHLQISTHKVLLFRH
jgi:hypothetical protein